VVEQQFAELQGYLRDEKGLVAELQRLVNGAYLVSVRNVQLRDGWSRGSSDVFFLVPPGYPAAKPDCFWVSPHLRLLSGAIPQNTNDGTPIPGDPVAGRLLTWFSWHLQTWDPNHDKLATFYAAIIKRLIPAR
jgi:E2/UBC family protein E